MTCPLPRRRAVTHRRGVRREAGRRDGECPGRHDRDCPAVPVEPALLEPYERSAGNLLRSRRSPHCSGGLLPLLSRPSPAIGARRSMSCVRRQICTIPSPDIAASHRHDNILATEAEAIDYSLVVNALRSWLALPITWARSQLPVLRKVSNDVLATPRVAGGRSRPPRAHRGSFHGRAR